MTLNMGTFIGSLFVVVVYLAVVVLLLVALVRAALAIVKIDGSMRIVAARHRLDVLVQCKEMGLVDEDEFAQRAATIRDQCL